MAGGYDVLLALDVPTRTCICSKDDNGQCSLGNDEGTSSSSLTNSPMLLSIRRRNALVHLSINLSMMLTFFNRARRNSPHFGWLKLEREKRLETWKIIRCPRTARARDQLCASCWEKGAEEKLPNKNRTSFLEWRRTIYTLYRIVSGHAEWITRHSRQNSSHEAQA